MMFGNGMTTILRDLRLAQNRGPERLLFCSGMPFDLKGQFFKERLAFR
jgi:hypothetical protein